MHISRAIIGTLVGLGLFSIGAQEIGEPPSVPAQVDLPPISLETIYTDDHGRIASLPQKNVVTMMATGDVIPARSVNTKTLGKGDFRWPYEKTYELLSGADITVVNLEAPLISGCPPTDTGMIFCSDPRAVEGLVYAGVDVATLGNNHIGNYYQKGIDETKSMLSAYGISYVLEGAIYKVIKGTTFGFLAYNDIGTMEEGVPWADVATVQADIRDARERSDIVIVSFHWGVEYTTEPTDRQKLLAHAAVDAGADVILGNHPHWIQPVELYRDKFIIYAHGNFVFDQMWSEETKHGVVGKYTFYEKKLIDVRYIPVYIKDYGQPQILDNQTSENILHAMEKASINLANDSQK